MSHHHRTVWGSTLLPTGRRLCLTNPDPADLDPYTIAHMLSMQARFNGACRRYYSVAQHSVIVSHHCEEQNAFVGLMHDAAEVIGDVVAPVKAEIRAESDVFDRLERRIWLALCARYGLPEDIPADVDMTDKQTVITEARDLTQPQDWRDWYPGLRTLPETIYPLPQPVAYDRFLQRYSETCPRGLELGTGHRHNVRRQ